jgi:hypothetical protein
MTRSQALHLFCRQAGLDLNRCRIGEHKSRRSRRQSLTLLGKSLKNNAIKGRA